MVFLICDDNRDEAERLAEMIKSHISNAVTHVFHSGEDALAFYLSDRHIDVCVFDILMPEMSGVTLAEHLRANGFRGQIVFLTMTNDFAHQSYKVGAFYYMLKPADKDGVTELLEKVRLAREGNDTRELMIKTAKGVCSVPFRDISHIEVINHSVYVRLLSRYTIKTYVSLAEVASRLLEDSRFARCHRSYLLNITAVTSLNGRDAVMRCGAVVPVSRKYQSDISKRFVEHKTKGSGGGSV